MITTRLYDPIIVTIFMRLNVLSKLKGFEGFTKALHRISLHHPLHGVYIFNCKFEDFIVYTSDSDVVSVITKCIHISIHSRIFHHHFRILLSDVPQVLQSWSSRIHYGWRKLVSVYNTKMKRLKLIGE